MHMIDDTYLIFYARVLKLDNQSWNSVIPDKISIHCNIK